MVITNEIKSLAKQAAFIPITTLSKDGNPHLVVVGQVKEIRDNDILVFGIYKMERTQKNIAVNNIMQVVLADVSGSPKGIRLSGKACIDEKNILFKAEKCEKLL